MINICTSCPIDFSDNALYVVSHVLHIEQWYSFVTIKLVEKACCVLVLCSQRAESASILLVSSGQIHSLEYKICVDPCRGDNGNNNMSCGVILWFSNTTFK